jgi:hypothetical protein
MTASWIEPPPPPRSEQGMGCFAKGCLILAIFLAVLMAAFVVGSIYAMRHLRTTFFATEHVDLPPNNSTAEEQQLALAHWKIFERSARAHAPARIEMTADELNALIASDRKLRGTAFVTITGNEAQVRLSVPLESRWLHGRYINGECTVSAAPDGDPARARISGVRVNGNPVPDEVLIMRGPFTLRRYLEEWTQTNDVKTFEIRDGKVILETKGSG